MKNIKSVVHISTSAQIGGAAIAAWRLHEGMRNLGVDSRVVCRHPNSVTSDVSSVTTPLFQVLDLLNAKLVVPAQPEGSTLFSLSPLSLSLLDHPWIAAADVIHLHWIAQFIAPEDIAELCKAGKTVFWTFHDQWPYTGGCHYIGGSTRHEGDWDGSAQIGFSVHEFARLEFQRKKQLFKNLPIHVIAPSRWMAEEAVASGVFRQEQVHVIPYGINTSVFRPARFQPNLPLSSLNHVNLLFGCQWLGDPRKGYNEFRQALNSCMLDAEFAAAVAAGMIRVQTFGGIPETGIDLPIPVIHLGALAGEIEVADLLRASSAFICPALEDNLPNVVMESLACGCPVVGFATGGVPDMVVHEKNGLLATKGDCDALARHILNFCLNKPLRERLRENAGGTNLKHYSLETQASRILELYEVFNLPVDGKDRGVIGVCPPSLQIDSKIISHFGTEIIKILVGDKDLSQSRWSAKFEQLSQELEQTQTQVFLTQKQIPAIRNQLSEAQSNLTQSEADRQLLLLQLRQAQDELEAYFLDNGRLMLLNSKHRLSAKKDRFKAKQIKLQLSYQLGSTIIGKSRNPVDWLKMPFSLMRVILRHRTAKRKRRLLAKKPIREEVSHEISNNPSTLSKTDRAVARVKRQLSYRIGNAFVNNSRSFMGWMRLPFAIAAEIIDFKKTKIKTLVEKGQSYSGDNL